MDFMSSVMIQLPYKIPKSFSSVRTAWLDHLTWPLAYGTALQPAQISFMSQNMMNRHIIYPMKCPQGLSIEYGFLT